MKFTVNKLASRLFWIFLLLTIVVPVLAFLLAIFTQATGDYAVFFIPILFFFNIYFFPIYALFGKTMFEQSAFGVAPRNLYGALAVVRCKVNS